MTIDYYALLNGRLEPYAKSKLAGALVEAVETIMDSAISHRERVERTRAALAAYHRIMDTPVAKPRGRRKAY